MSQTYDRVSQIFHWLLAALILFLIFYHPSTEDGHDAPTKLQVLIHVTIGFSVFFLAFGRLFWKIFFSVHPKSEKQTKLQSKAKKVVHFLFYVFMWLAPIFGLVLAFSSELEISLFGYLELPKLAFLSEYHDLIRSFHGASADVLLYLAIIHVGAVLYHQLWLKDNLLNRMIKS